VPAARYYRKGKTSEIILETVNPPDKAPNMTEETKAAIKKAFVDQVGTEFTVGKIREYGKHGIVFTFRVLTHDGKEVCNIPIRFDKMLETWGHPNL